MLNFGNKEFRNLQEQVLKNAQDIETLKGREDLQIVIVNELPEVGNPNYIYLVAKDDGESPDVYDEYIWLVDSETYEKIGGVTIDLTNYVTLDSEQTITGEKTIANSLAFSDKTDTSPTTNSVETDNYGRLLIRRNNDAAISIAGSDVRFYARNIIPSTGNTTYSLGESSSQWKDIHLSDSIVWDTTNEVYMKVSGNTLTIKNRYNSIVVNQGNTTFNDVVFVGDMFPRVGNYSIGSASRPFKDFCLVGNISDGVNSVTVANIASKVTSTYASGTFDSNGESTIDISGGTPEGLFIFTYGNCQCFVRLTAAMISSADTAPIRVSCPMIYNSATTLGWLNITKSGTTLTLKITDGTNHVDSGYAWTLTKTNLI